MIGIFAAMESEVLACPAWTRSSAKTEVDGALVYQGDGAWVCQTGVGREPARRSVEAVLSKLTPDAVLSVGLAGGLAPEIRIGDVVVCTHVDHESHRHSDEEQSVYAHPGLLDTALDVAQALDVPVQTGASLTADEAAWGPAEKAAHHAWKSHEIVEMESFWIAEAASRRGVPFLAVRAISDASGDSLPNTGATRPDGTLDQQKFLDYLREHPEAGAQLSALAQNARLALANLASYLGVFLARVRSGVGAV